MNTLFDQIEASAKIDDLDEAVRPIQDILGQDDGGHASRYFSDITAFGEGGYYLWRMQNETVRKFHLIRYVVYELGMMERAL